MQFVSRVPRMPIAWKTLDVRILAFNGASWYAPMVRVEGFVS